VSLLKIKEITVKFGGLIAVSNFNLTLETGEIVGLIGPNGAGKTTAFNTITGICKPASGSVNFNDNEIVGLSPDKITKLGIARTFQNIRLFQNLSVLENVMVGQHLRLKSSLVAAILRIHSYIKEEEAMKEETRNLLKSVHLEEMVEEKAGSLPYGKQRKLEIARGLATHPKLLLLDEPAAGMNPQEAVELMEFINEIRDKFGLTILIIEHQMAVIMGICERILVMDHGVTIAEGNPSEIQHNQQVIEAYLGVEDDA